jgi:predicted CXXCH cytochrome family protein
MKMKKTLILAVCMVLVASAAFAGTSIVNSKHDLSSGVTGTVGANDEICVFCHTPHNAAAGTAALAPLWSHTSTAQTNYTVYANPFSTIQGTINQPGNVSLACLSCHDGTIAVGSIANGFYAGDIDTAPHDGATNYGTGIAGLMTGGALLDTDLRNDHPVGITYNNTADTGLVAPTGSYVGALPLFPNASAQLQVECGSCHNVHNPSNVPFLRITNTKSTLCLTCHIK